MLAILTSRTRILCAYNSTCQAISLAARTRFCRLYKPAGFTLFALNGTAIALIFCGWANYIDLARFFLSSVESTMPLEMQLMSDCPTGYTRRLNSSTFCEFAVLSFSPNLPCRREFWWLLRPSEARLSSMSRDEVACNCGWEQR